MLYCLLLQIFRQFEERQRQQVGSLRVHELVLPGKAGLTRCGVYVSAVEERHALVAKPGIPHGVVLVPEYARHLAHYVEVVNKISVPKQRCVVL